MNNESKKVSDGEEDKVVEEKKELVDTISLVSLMDEEATRELDPTPELPIVPPKRERFIPPAVHDKPTVVRPRSVSTPISERKTEPIQPVGSEGGKQVVPSNRPKREVRSPIDTPRQTPTRAPIRELNNRVVMPEKEIVLPKVAKGKKRGVGCIGRFLITGLLLFLIGLVIGLIVASVGYMSIAKELPLPRDLVINASNFETAHVYDRNGDEIYTLADPTTGNRTYVPLSDISPYLVEATIATEDARFYTHPGFDPIGILRAVYQAALEGEFVSGASTITQQLTRALLLDEEERTQRTFKRKIKEIILAAEINRTYSKEEILELYLNEIYYGNRAYGIEAAAETYFGKTAAELTLSEASLLAGLPQAPAWWDPYSAPQKALGRQSEVLLQMIAEQYISSEEGQAALNESALVVYNMVPPEVDIPFPHFTFTVLQQLESAIGAQAMYRGGLKIYTTLDPAAQLLAQDVLAQYKDGVNAAGANNGVIVSIQPKTGEILALVGSLDFNDDTIDGQVNMVLQPRQPGSSIKPFVFLNAMEQGWSPSTLIWDVPTKFPNGANPPYEPKNYDDEFHGPLLLRPALGNSYNIPAIKALEYVGVCPFISRMRQIGFHSLEDSGCTEVGSPRNYGLALAVGGGEISPMEMATGFAILANQGKLQQPFYISRIEDRVGQILFDQKDVAVEQQVISAAHAYLLSDILSDNNARQPEFGINNLLRINNHRVAVKTGTSGSSSRDVRDGWTIGYTPEVVTAVWVGNTDNSPVDEGASGYSLASPIWNSYMNQYLADKSPVDFPIPPDVVKAEICADSGTRPSDACQNRITEIFSQAQLPLYGDKDFVQKVDVDLWTNLISTEYCQENIYEATFFNVLVSGRPEVEAREKESALNWITGTDEGKEWAKNFNIAIPFQPMPTEKCTKDTPRPTARLTQPLQNSEITADGEVEIVGSAQAPNFTGYRVEFGWSHNPEGWGEMQPERTHQVDNNLLARWDLSEVPDGAVTIKLTIFGPDNPYTEEEDRVVQEARLLLNMIAPTATATNTPTPTDTATATPEPSSTPTITATPSNTPTATETNTPTITPTPSETPPIVSTAPPRVTPPPDLPTLAPPPTDG